jgi:hypothetical protein
VPGVVVVPVAEPGVVVPPTAAEPPTVEPLPALWAMAAVPDNASAVANPIVISFMMSSSCQRPATRP